MRRPGGYAITISEAGTHEEDTFTCAHGNEIVFVRPGEDPANLGGFCRMCMKHICARCAAKGGCTPFEKKLEAMERRDRLRRVVTG